MKANLAQKFDQFDDWNDEQSTALSTAHGQDAIVRSNLELLRKAWPGIHIERFECGNCISIPDSKTCKCTVVRFPSNAAVISKIDNRFLGELHTSGLLVDHALTAQMWGEAETNNIGIKPSIFMSSKDIQTGTPAVVFVPNHFGWQKKEWFYSDRKLQYLKDDFNSDTKYERTAIFRDLNGNWQAGIRTIDFSNPITSLKDTQTAFSLPLLVQNGVANNIPDFISRGDPRFICDPRILIDFYGKVVPSKVSVLFRRLLPILNKEHLLALYNGEKIESTGVVAWSERDYVAMKELLAEHSINNFNISYEGVSEGRGRVTFKNTKSLPHNRVPLYIIGIDDESRLVIFAFDGRRDGYSNGITLEEAQKLAIKFGIRHAGFGPSGEDVALSFVSAASGTLPLGVPSSKNFRPRGVPSLIALSPK